MKNNIIETLVGFIVIFTAIFFLFFTYNAHRSDSDGKGYIIKASFQNVEGIIKGSDVMLAGIKIGTVESMDLDYDSFFAIVTLYIEDNIKLPKDSNAAIVSSGFLGSKFISITPGVSDEFLKHKDKIIYTQSSVNLEALIGKFMYTFGSNSTNQKQN